jgi:hypothetical protein
MSYFNLIVEECNKLNLKAQTYLDSLPFIDNDTLINKIWSWAWEQMDKDQNGYVIFNGKNSLAEEIIDEGVPYTKIPNNSSIHYSLGWAIVAQDANLRSLYEFIEGRQTEQLTFKMLADLPEIENEKN